MLVEDSTKLLEVEEKVIRGSIMLLEVCKKLVEGSGEEDATVAGNWDIFELGVLSGGA